MDLPELSKGVRTLWEQKPGAVVLLILGFLIFVFLVVDAWRHKHPHKRSSKWRP